ncbi:hypothetical protein [Arvimicrobium flavum]|uniref:hypothetical protein n=1 Tax=Arvimicrobium flavum TaxID=3393320 RepID=UPI00237BB342|nr:hypothetical protein [Mesorhizobium shangrilense]
MGIDGPKQRATYSIDGAVKETLDERVPKSARSAFVERAIADALRRDAVHRLREILDKAKGSSTGGEDSVELLRRLRRERNEYLTERHRT